MDCRRLHLPCPDGEQLKADISALFADRGDGIAKIVITRGPGGRGYAPPVDGEPTRMVLRYPKPQYPKAYAETGVAIGVADIRLARQPALAGVKHLNRLEQVLARRECATRGWPEALMCTDDGCLISGTMSNLFVVRDQALLTPALDQAGVIGAMRSCLIEGFARQGYMITETDLPLAAATDCDEAFLCNSAMPVWPVYSVGGCPVPLGPLSRLARSIIEQE